MVVNSRFGWVLALWSLWIGVACAQVSGNAAELVRQGMGPSFSYNVIALLSQRDPQGAGRQLIQMKRDKAGRTRHSVVHPLSKQGTESIDDGVRFVTQLPDEKIMIEQESMVNDQGDPGFRMALARRNYTFRIDSRPKVAGRTCVRVVAKPNATGMEVRRFCFDAANGFLMKLETISPSGTVTSHFEVMDVEFPKTLSPNVFKIRQPVGMRLLKYQRPPAVASIAQAREDLPFAPIVPDELPLGFRVRFIQVNKGQWESLAIHLTDGLARATVYEWRPGPEGRDAKALEGRSVKDAGQVRIMCVSDMAPSVREKLLAAFQAQLRRVMGDLEVAAKPIPPTFIASDRLRRPRVSIVRR